ncbi:MAG TPA: prolipoprotein diacylglyceryl transferase [Chitinophagales bacterium]|nr:prolipoprotein diacylglyceryl transferase [Chitinophagales bacterium]HNF68184.1 prolipoprotein diacylglyceryl transferase [Chitinophagales bacterium]
MILLRSYANLGEFFNAVFGTNMRLPVFSFGFFVGLAFMAAGYILYRELRRKEKAGIFHAEKVKVMVGEPASAFELISNAVFGFILGFKIGGMIFNWQTFNDDPQSFMFSGEGNILVGLLGAALLAYSKYREKKKEQLPQPQEKTLLLYPSARLGDFVMLAAIFGILGAKMFSNFEEENGWSEFLQNPFKNFFSGLTIYGGLILGAAAIIYYAIRKKINVLHLGDAVAPALILAYGIGRIGCQVSGDGDWGIINSAYISQENGTLREAEKGEIDSVIQIHAAYYIREFDSLSNVKSVYVKAPGFLPRSLVAQNYAYNVNKEGMYIAKCQGDYCGQLPASVFPTPIYETIMSLMIFGMLWWLRRRVTVPGMILAIYVIFVGIERFFIEKIRVNNVLEFAGIRATQATFISIIFVIFGLVMALVLVQVEKRRRLSH